MAAFKKRHGKHLDLYLLLLPALLSLIVFKYVPMYGIIIAFKDYSVSKGVLGSPWVGLQNLEELLRSSQFTQVLTNTLLINLYKLIFQFPLPIILALLINEVMSANIKRMVQTVTYLPHFLSWVVISGVFIDVLSPETGIVNSFLNSLGLESIFFMIDEDYFRSVLVASSAWKETGWSSIIYLAAIMSVDTQLYDAAKVDGAGKLKQIWHVTLPGISSTIIFIIMLRLGHALSTDLEQVLTMYSASVFSVGDVLGTYIYREGISQLRFSFATAAGLFQSGIGLALMIAANSIARRYGEKGIW